MPQIQFMVLFSSLPTLMTPKFIFQASTSALNSKLLYSTSLLGCLMDSSNFTPQNSILIFATPPHCFSPRFPYFRCWQLQIFQLFRPKTLEASMSLTLTSNIHTISRLHGSTLHKHPEPNYLHSLNVIQVTINSHLGYCKSPNHSLSFTHAFSILDREAIAVIFLKHVRSGAPGGLS